MTKQALADFRYRVKILFPKQFNTFTFAYFNEWRIQAQRIERESIRQKLALGSFYDDGPVFFAGNSCSSPRFVLCICSDYVICICYLLLLSSSSCVLKEQFVIFTALCCLQCKLQFKSPSFLLNQPQTTFFGKEKKQHILWITNNRKDTKLIGFFFFWAVKLQMEA